MHARTRPLHTAAKRQIIVFVAKQENFRIISLECWCGRKRTRGIISLSCTNIV